MTFCTLTTQSVFWYSAELNCVLLFKVTLDKPSCIDTRSSQLTRSVFGYTKVLTSTLTRWPSKDPMAVRTGPFCLHVGLHIRQLSLCLFLSLCHQIVSAKTLCFWAVLLFRSFVRPFVWSDIFTMISHERLVPVIWLEPPKFLNGSHYLTTPLSGTVCRPWAVTCTILYIKFEVFAITSYEDA